MKPAILFCGFFLLACASASVVVPPGTISPSGALPDTVPCSHPLVVKAGDEMSGVDAERSWVDAHYPGHSGIGQGLHIGKGRAAFDVVTFRSREGRDISLCFDISSYFGKYD